MIFARFSRSLYVGMMTSARSVPSGTRGLSVQNDTADGEQYRKCECDKRDRLTLFVSWICEPELDLACSGRQWYPHDHEVGARNGRRLSVDGGGPSGIEVLRDEER